MDTLAPGEMMTCTANGTAEDLASTGFTTVPGLCGSVPETPLYENMGTATGETITGEIVEDVDPSHYCNPPRAEACLIIIDEEGVDNDFLTVENSADDLNITPDKLVNNDRPTETSNPWFRWNNRCAKDKYQGNPGCLAKMPTGQVDDEGWFALPPLIVNGEVTGIQYADKRPRKCNKYTKKNSSGTEAGYNLFVDQFIAGTVPQACLDKIRRVMPLRNQELVQLVGRSCVAVVYDSDISMNYEPIYANLQGARYGLFSFTVEAVETAGNIEDRNDQWPYILPESKSDTSLYDLWLRIEKFEPGAPFRIKIQDHEPDSIQIEEATYSGGVLRVKAKSDFAKDFGGTDITPPTPADPEFGNDPNNSAVYMTVSVDGPDEGSDHTVDPFILEVPMTYLSDEFFEFALPAACGALDGRRVTIQTDEGGAYNREINK